MLVRSEQVRVVQNLSLRDRVVRFVIGALLFAPGLIAATAVFTHTGPELSAWLVGMMALSAYPLMTGMIGVDPLYRLFGFRTCGDSGANQCGTLPYQLKARKGEAPQYCEADDTRGLEACHDEPRTKPRHPTWQVDQDPMLYPDDAALAKYSARQKGKQGS